jgi:hypothetical protein
MGVIWFRAFVFAPGYPDHCSLHASYLLEKNRYKAITYLVIENRFGRILHDAPSEVVRNAR